MITRNNFISGASCLFVFFFKGIARYKKRGSSLNSIYTNHAHAYQASSPHPLFFTLHSLWPNAPLPPSVYPEEGHHHIIPNSKTQKNKSPAYFSTDEFYRCARFVSCQLDSFPCKKKKNSPNVWFKKKQDAVCSMPHKFIQSEKGGVVVKCSTKNELKAHLGLY